MFNQITVIGNICQEIKLSYTQSGVAFINNSVASSYRYSANDGTIKEETCFLNFSVFGRNAENMNQYLHKGSKVFLQGRLVQENYTDKEGKNRTNYKIAVETMKFLDSKPADNNQSGNPYENVQESPTMPTQTESMQQEQTVEVTAHTMPTQAKPVQQEQGDNFPF